MHTRDPSQWQHNHDYLASGHERNERQTRFVIVLTATMMVAEIAAGGAFNSMALLADGWHMASHASALSITAFAYWFARRHRNDERFSFGTWKVGVLGGFTSAVVLGVVALLIVSESIGRFFEPLSISFDEAIVVATIGLIVNLVSALLLKDGHEHGHAAGHTHDHNLRAAYLHVLADALTSVTAIFALICGRFFGWTWMDPAMGLVGALVIGRWAYGLLRDSSAVLLDGDVAPETVDALRHTLEGDTSDLVADLHVWKVGPGKMAALVSIVSDEPKAPEYYKVLMESRVALAHSTVEVNPCPGADHGARAS